MTEQLFWIPPLVFLESYNGNWDEYIRAVYEFFRKDFVEDKPVYEGKKISVKRYPIIDGKEITFWHIISEGNEEINRTPDLRRCERIRWPRPIVEHASHPAIKIWRNERRGETRICIWLESHDYLVVLADRGTYKLFWTAYSVTRNHTKRKLLKEYLSFKKAGAA